MNRAYNFIAVITTPGAILLNLEDLSKNMNVLNLLLTFIVSVVSIVSLIFIIRKNYYQAKHERYEIEKIQTEIEYKIKMKL